MDKTEIPILLQSKSRDTHRPEGQCFLLQRILYSDLLRLDTP